MAGGSAGAWRAAGAQGLTRSCLLVGALAYSLSRGVGRVREDQLGPVLRNLGCFIAGHKMTVRSESANYDLRVQRKNPPILMTRMGGFCYRGAIARVVHTPLVEDGEIAIATVPAAPGISCKSATTDSDTEFALSPFVASTSFDLPDHVALGGLAVLLLTSQIARNTRAFAAVVVTVGDVADVVTADVLLTDASTGAEFFARLSATVAATILEALALSVTLASVSPSTISLPYTTRRELPKV